jgi:DNA primase small subunit
MSDLSNPLIMITFYRRLFPFKQLFLWLNQEQSPSFLSISRTDES